MEHDLAVGECGINETGRDRNIVNRNIICCKRGAILRNKDILYVESCVFYHSHHNWCHDQDRQLTGRRAQREAIRVKHQMDPSFSGKEEDTEIAFRPIRPDVDPSPPAPLSSPSTETQYGVVLDIVQKLNSEMDLITLDNDKIRTVCEKLLDDNKDRDRAMCDLTRLVKRSLDRPSERLPQPDAFKPNAFKPHPIIRPDLINNDGNLGPRTSVSPGQVPIHSYMESRLLDQMLRDSLRELNRTRRHHTNL